MTLRVVVLGVSVPSNSVGAPGCQDAAGPDRLSAARAW